MRIEKQLEKFENLLIPHSAIVSMLKGYKRPNDKISSLIKSGEIIKVKNGFYVLAQGNRVEQLSLPLIANALSGPSYVSLDYALSLYGLIPEGVFEITSVTTSRSKKFDTQIGLFSYSYSKPELYEIGVVQQSTSGNKNFLIASPEKALCDKLILTKNLGVNSINSMESFIVDDMRVDTDYFADFDISIIKQCVEVGYKTTLLKLFCKVVEKFK